MDAIAFPSKTSHRESIRTILKDSSRPISIIIIIIIITVIIIIIIIIIITIIIIIIIIIIITFVCLQKAMLENIYVNKKKNAPTLVQAGADWHG